MQCKQRLNYNEAFERLDLALKRDHSRLSKPRKLILEMLLRKKRPFSAEDLFAELSMEFVPNARNTKSKGSRLSQPAPPDLATIYRNLSYFAAIGLINRVDAGSEMAFYEIGSKDNSHHHHYFICRKCGTNELLSSCELKEIESLLQKKGYREIRHRLEFSGVCPNCSE